MQKTAVKAPYLNTLHVRLDDELRGQLQEAADKHRIPLIREIRLRLIDSFDIVDKRRHESLNNDFEVLIARFSNLVTDIDLGRQLAKAVANNDQGKTKDLARLINARARHE